MTTRVQQSLEAQIRIHDHTHIGVKSELCVAIIQISVNSEQNIFVSRAGYTLHGFREDFLWESHL